MSYRHTIDGQTWVFRDLKDLMAKATAQRSGDSLAGIAADSYAQRMAARMCLAELPLKRFLQECLVPYESDEVSRLIIDTHDTTAFAPIAHLTVGELRDWLLSDLAGPDTLDPVRPGITPEMAAAVSKLMRNQDLVIAARKCQVVTRFRNTIGLPGRLSVRLQPNHPTDSAGGIAASTW